MADGTTVSTGSDSDAIKALHQTLIDDQQKVSDLQNQYNQAVLDHNKAVSDYAALDAQYKDVQNRFQVLHNAGKWDGTKVGSESNIQGPTGQHYYVSPNSSQIWANDAGFAVLKQQWADWQNKATALNAIISGTQATVNNLLSPDGKSGTLANAQATVDKDINNIVNFTPTTTQGQVDHAAAVQAAAAISSNNTQIAAQQTAQKQADAQAAISTANYASVNTQYLIWGGVALGVIVIFGLIIMAVVKKKKATA